jgi:hypothetical protein
LDAGAGVVPAGGVTGAGFAGGGVEAGVESAGFAAAAGFGAAGLGAAGFGLGFGAADGSGAVAAWSPAHLTTQQPHLPPDSADGRAARLGPGRAGRAGARGITRP